jgi:acetyl-CoA synthetase
MEIESALVDNPAVAEAAAVGVADAVKGQALVVFVTLKDGHRPSADMEADLKEHVVRKIGAIARPERIIFGADLPKTRSGKIMRRLLRDIGEGRVLGDTSTLADADTVEHLKNLYEEGEEA